jgi:hypothetical protein
VCWAWRPGNIDEVPRRRFEVNRSFHLMRSVCPPACQSSPVIKSNAQSRIQICLWRLGVDIGESIVVGDSVWDLLAARRAKALGVGGLSGGSGQDELERAGAYRVYQDPYDLLKHLDELGVRAAG